MCQAPAWAWRVNEGHTCRTVFRPDVGCVMHRRQGRGWKCRLWGPECLGRGSTMDPQLAQNELRRNKNPNSPVAMKETTPEVTDLFIKAKMRPRWLSEQGRPIVEGT